MSDTRTIRSPILLFALLASSCAYLGWEKPSAPAGIDESVRSCEVRGQGVNFPGKAVVQKGVAYVGDADAVEAHSEQRGDVFVGRGLLTSPKLGRMLSANAVELEFGRVLKMRVELAGNKVAVKGRGPNLKRVYTRSGPCSNEQFAHGIATLEWWDQVAQERMDRRNDAGR